MGPRIFCGSDHSLDASVPEASGNDDAVYAIKGFLNVFFGNLLGIDPPDLYLCFILISGMLKCFRNGQIRIMELYVFSDKTDDRGLFKILNTLDHFSPVIEIGFARFDTQFPAYDL